ncbi:hypothetical protein [Algoriphagus sp. CAU 1675]|uniref:hypothetical protein n=1 Tax=Algoriphagus sp. CAU 1675 TaxID=3032597 RepID=UPI0023DC0AF8|nr:hypothetical protein [Algoriphagus sp. CAU 1675]MDF2157774.1 hypothetical protein [Algoriphagus sp. CAU 1675]
MQKTNKLKRLWVAILAYCFTPTVLFGQSYSTGYSDPAPIYEQGLSVSILGRFDLTWNNNDSGLFGSKGFNLEFVSFVGGVNTLYGIEYKGKVYHDYSFDGSLKEYFSALKVRAINYQIKVHGLKESTCQNISDTNAAPGSKVSRFCKDDGNQIWIDKVIITKVYLDGVAALQRRIDELEREAQELEKKEEERLKKEQEEKEELERLEKIQKENLQLEELKKLEKLKIDQANKELLDQQQSDTESIQAQELEAAEKRRAEALQKHKEHLKEMDKIYNSKESIDLRAKMLQAKALEAEGDQLWEMGSMYAFQAYKKYEEAQKIYFSNDVKLKMNEIGGYVQLAQGLSAMGDIIDQELEEVITVLDPERKSSWSHLGIYHVGNFSSIGDLYAQEPSSTSLVMAMNFLAISLDLRASYHVLPVQTYSIYREGWNLVMPETATISTTAFGLGFSAGLNLPFKYVQPYATFGKDVLFPDKYDISAPNFEYDGAGYPGNDKTLTRYIVGVNFQIPNTSLGLGLSYNLSTLSGGEKLDSVVQYNMQYTGTDSSRANSRGLEYQLYENLNENYKYNNFGVNLFYRFSAR